MTRLRKSFDGLTGDELRAWRTAKKLTQVQLAGRLEITDRTIIDYESGKRPIPRVVELAVRALDEEIPDA